MTKSEKLDRAIKFAQQPQEYMEEVFTVAKAIMDLHKSQRFMTVALQSKESEREFADDVQMVISVVSTPDEDDTDSEDTDDCIQDKVEEDSCCETECGNAGLSSHEYIETFMDNVSEALLDIAKQLKAMQNKSTIQDASIKFLLEKQLKGE